MRYPTFTYPGARPAPTRRDTPTERPTRVAVQHRRGVCRGATRSVPAPMTDDDLTLLLMSGSWYPENAYMTLLADALREAGVDVRTPPLPLFFPLTRAVLANRDADAMQLDWIYDYYVTTGTGVGPANAVV